MKRICTDNVESNVKQKGKRRTKKAVLTGQVNKGASNSCACRKKKLITFLRAFPVKSASTTHTCARKERFSEDTVRLHNTRINNVPHY